MQHLNTDTEHKAESKRDKFLRLSARRTKEAEESIRLIENLFQNPYAYDYDYADVEKIVHALNASIHKLEKYWRLKPYHTLPTFTHTMKG